LDVKTQSTTRRRPSRSHEPLVREYNVKEIYYTLQGEGLNAGRPAVFCRFSGCNLWSGREVDRDTAVCRFCDTRFVGIDGPGGGIYSSAEALGTTIRLAWPSTEILGTRPLVVFTGGEPLLQLTADVVDRVHDNGFEVAIETNGTLLPPPGVDWICVSPKAHAVLRLRHGSELKLVFPQEGAEPQRYEELAFQHFLLQPMDGPHREKNIALAVRYCLEHPRWRLSLQTQKFLGIP
jgi:7-carboxy-7-deazaguanine synthase (Cx14CxxC type)